MMCWFTYAVFCSYAAILLSIANCNNVNDPSNRKKILDTVPVVAGAPKTLDTVPIIVAAEAGAPKPNILPVADPCADNNTLFVEVGRTLFHCLNNTRMIFGCKFDGAILADGDTIIRENYLLQCQTNEARDQASMIEIACYVDNRILGPGQTYVDGHEFYTCTWNNETEDLAFEKTGCVDDQKKLIKEGQTAVRGYYNFRCMATIEDPHSIKFRLVKDGCAVDNYAYKPGQIIIMGDYWYTCEKFQNVQTNEVDYVIKPGGCIVDFGFLNVGEIFHKKAYIYKCEETTISNLAIVNSAAEKSHLPSDWPFLGVRRAIVGCLEVTPKKTIVEHSPGDKWVETKFGTEQKFLIECGLDDDTKKEPRPLAKVATECYLDRAKGQQLDEPKSMKPGCIARVKNSLWKCSKQADGQLLSIVDEKAGLEETIRAILSGYAFC